MRHGRVRGFASVVAKQGLFVYFCPFVHAWAAFSGRSLEGRLMRESKQRNLLKDMKKILLSVMAAALCFCTSQFAQAQSMKVGFVNTADLLLRMPASDSAQQVLQTYGKEIEDSYMLMVTEYQNKATEFQNSQSQWSDLIKQTKQQELQDMGRRIEEFGQQSQEDLQRKTQELYAPTIASVTKAIEAVAKEQKLTCVFDKGDASLSMMGSGLNVPSVFYGEGSMDVTPLVEKKLGLPSVPAAMN